MRECVNVHVTDGVATIRMDRPPMNAISVQVQAELRAAAATVSAAPAIHAVVVYGGEKTFAAGADVKEMADKDYPAMVAVSQAMHASFSAIATIPEAGCRGGHRLRARRRAGTGAVCGLSGVRRERQVWAAGNTARDHPRCRWHTTVARD